MVSRPRKRRSQRSFTPTRATPDSRASSGSASASPAGLGFDEALALSRAGTVFTTHTPVPAGIDRFPRELVERHFGPTNPDYAALTEIPLSRILAFGAEDDPAIFNMAHMGLRLAQRANGVSLLHGKV